MSKNKVKLVPVKDKDTIILYDVFVNGEWCGSRRTEDFAKAYARFLCEE
jgi:hypothetical protein